MSSCTSLTSVSDLLGGSPARQRHGRRGEEVARWAAQSSGAGAPGPPASPTAGGGSPLGDDEAESPGVLQLRLDVATGELVRGLPARPPAGSR